MKNVKKELFVTVNVVVVAVLWVIILLISGIDLSKTYEAFTKLPEVVTGYVILQQIFTRWAWRWPLFRWLTEFPDLSGTWDGELKSTWVDPKTNQRIPTIKATLIIRQGFDTISCELITEESSSHSRVMTVLNSDDNLVEIVFDYLNTPKSQVRNRSEMHHGAAHLRLSGSASHSLKLEGSYWTDRQTAGDMEFTRITLKTNR